MPDHARHRFGLMHLIAGAALDSTSGLFSRLLSADGFTIVAGRGLVGFGVLFALLIARDGRRAGHSLLGLGAIGLIFACINASGMVMNILSLKHTAVANFFMIFATAPFVAAIAGRIFLGERLDLATGLAALAGFVGIAVMMAGGAKSGGLIGDLLALGCVLTYSSIVLIVRRFPGLDTLPLITLTLLISTLIALPFADIGTFHGRALTLIVAFGVIQLALGNMLIFIAAARIPAAQSGLLGVLNAAFAPAWVYVFLGEIPPPATLAGGAIVISAALLHLIWTLSLARNVASPP